MIGIVACQGPYLKDGFWYTGVFILRQLQLISPLVFHESFFFLASGQNPFLPGHTSGIVQPVVVQDKNIRIYLDCFRFFIKDKR